LKQIIDQVQTLTGSFEIVNEGMQSQSAGAEQISEALAQLSNSVRQTVESIRASTPAIEELNGAARGLQSGIARFMLQS
jgi:methyl-accepting chemotaxis protein WspA